MVRLPSHFSDDFLRQLRDDLDSIAVELGGTSAVKDAFHAASNVLTQALETRETNG